MTTKSKVALFQMDCKFGETEVNVNKCVDAMKKAAREGCSLIVFPECALSGYCFDSLEEVARYAIPADGPDLARISSAAAELGIYAAVGFTENRGGKYYNSAAFISPDKGIEQVYSKMHMPYIGLDKFAEKGQPPLPPVETPFGRFSMIICYDIRFPELTRHLALSGADVIVHPTNWPYGSEYTRDVLPLARAFENGVYFLSCNRVGDEKSSHFIGGARVVGPNGRIVVQANDESEEMLICEIDVAASRQKHFYSVEGDWSIDIDKDRRPEVFGDPRKLYS